jgi:hypothetical protein
MRSKLLSTRLIRFASIPFFWLIVGAGNVVTLHAVLGSWTRGLPIGEIAADERKPPESFVLAVWSGDDEGHVHGICMFFNGKSVSAILEGTETSDGDFYPQVSTQVGDSDHGGEWKTLKPSVSPSGRVAARTIRPQEASRPLKVDLDVFRPFIGKKKYGRLLLRTGEATVFQIDDLQPPEKMTESSADFVKEKK